VAARFHVAGISVVIQFVGAEQHLRGFNPHIAAKVANRALGFLGNRFYADMLGIGSARTGRPNRLIGIRAR
jgi:hypothetical protein